MIKTLLHVLILFGCATVVRAQTTNIDFETATYANWLYYTGSCCPITTPSGGTSTPTGGRHALTSGTATDPYGGFPIVSPWGGGNSLKLGNDTGGAHSDRCRYYVRIPSGAAHYSLLYHYAVVLNDASHTTSMQPRMEIKAYDSATGLIIPCDSFYYVAGSSTPGFLLSSSTHLGAPIYYKPWTMGNLKLNGLGGHTIAIDFATGDCGAAGHFGYGYVDMTAGLFANTIYTSCSTSTITLTGPYGYTAYSWRDSATFSTVYGTTQNVTILTPGAPTTYALILTPYSGYGCTDTLYTRIIPTVPCSGTPYPGAAYTFASAICGDKDTLKVIGFSMMCGIGFQWQTSPDDSSWSNIPGATTDVYPYTRSYLPKYYRCLTTCIASSITTGSSSVFVPRLIGPGLYATINPPDSVCNGAQFYVGTCGTSTSYNVATWYGDGTFDITPLTTTGVRHANIVHNYGFPGRYSVRHILYDGTLAVDSTSYSHNYNYCSTFPLKFYYDKDNNCYRSPEESNRYRIRVEIDSNGTRIDTVYPFGGLYYHTLGGPGTIYKFHFTGTTAGGFYSSCPASGIIYDTVRSTVNLYSQKQFGYSCSSSSGFDLYGNGTTRSFTNLAVNRIYVNNHSCDSTAPTVTLNYSPKYTYSYSSPPPASITATSITWNLPYLTAYKTHYIAANFINATTLYPGDTVNSSWVINPFSGDVDTSNNVIKKTDTLLGPWDPNYIEVNPQGYISAGTQLTYTIHFENVGNDTAVNIHVMDTLSDLLDIRSLEMIFASADMDLALLKVGSYNIAKFDFPNINLPDSSHHGLAEGMFTFTINTWGSLLPGTIIPNRAGIYFDHNPVVLTNTVNNIIEFPTTSLERINKRNFQLFPNPANDELTIKTDEPSFKSFIITNTVGQNIIEEQIKGTQTRVNIKQLPAGIYYISLKGEDGNTVKKFVKM